MQRWGNICCAKFLLKALVCVAALIVLSLNANSQPVLDLEHRDDFHLRLTPFLSHFADKSLELTIEEIAVGEGQFTPVKTRYPDFGLGPDRHWLRATLRNTENTMKRWRLDFDRQYMQSMDAWIVREDGGIEKIFHTNDTAPFSARAINDRLLAADFDLSAKEQAQIVVGYTTTIVSFLPLAIGTIDAVQRSHTAEYIVDALFNGALLAMLVIGIVVMPIIGWRLSLSFSFYVLAGLLYVFHADGYTFQLFWPNNPSYNDPANLSFITFMGVFGLLFAHALFPLRKHTPRYSKAVLAYVFIASTFAVSSPLYVPNPVLQTIAYSLVPIGSVLQFVTGVVVWRKGYVGSMPYLMGATAVLLSFGYAVIAHVQPGAHNMDATLDFGHACILFDSFCFAAAVVQRMLAIRNERDRALREELAETQRRMRAESEQRETQLRFERARQQADARLAQLENVSHDLRVPLIAMRHAISRLEVQEAQERQHMQAAVDYIESLASSNLNGTTHAHDGAPSNQSVEIFSTHDVLDNVVEIYADAARMADMQIRYRRKSDNILFDPLALMRIVCNIVSNAIEHSGGTTLLLRVRSATDEIHIEIWDNGCGMSQKAATGFVVRGNKNDDSNGAGLGLSIARSMTLANGGKFDLCSKKNSGTRVRIAIPKSTQQK